MSAHPKTPEIPAEPTRSLAAISGSRSLPYEPRCPVCGNGMHRNTICGERVWRCNMADCRHTLPRESPTNTEMKKTLQPIKGRVLLAVESERAYQEEKWPGHDHTVAEWLLIMEKLMGDARRAWVTGHGDNQALHEVRQIVATGIACMEQCGAPHRGDAVTGRKYPISHGSPEHQYNVNAVLRKHNDAVCIQRDPLKFEVMDSTKDDAKRIGVAATLECAWSDAAGRIAHERIPRPPDPPKGKHPREWG